MFSMDLSDTAVGSNDPAGTAYISAALIAGWLLPKLGFVLIGGIGAAIINAVIGAVILLAVIGLFKKAA